MILKITEMNLLVLSLIHANREEMTRWNQIAAVRVGHSRLETPQIWSPVAMDRPLILKINEINAGR